MTIPLSFSTKWCEVVVYLGKHFSTGYKVVTFLERAEAFDTIFRNFSYCCIALYSSLVQETFNDSLKFILAKLTGNGILCE